MLTLDKLVPGETGSVVRIHGRGQIRRRLVDMGFTCGAEIEVVKLSPLGDPVEYRLRGYHLSLRKSEARFIEVELLEGVSLGRRTHGGSWSKKPLSHCAASQQIEVVRTRGGRRRLQRFQALNIRPGSVFTVIQNDFTGPLILENRDRERVEVGKGLARHILVKPVK